MEQIGFFAFLSARRASSALPTVVPASACGGEEPLQVDQKEPDVLSESKTPNSHSKTIKNTALYATVAVVLCLFCWANWDSINTLFDKEKLKAWLLKTLTVINRQGSRGLVVYVLAFALWEMAGLTATPVETVAGMTFGIQRGIIGSFIGKVLGAFLVYLLGRGLLNKAVRSRFSENEVLSLVDKTMGSKPFRCSLIMRYSSLPELLKNLGLAIMPPVKPALFLLVTVIHHLPFTVLWSHAGHDAALRLRASESGEELPANRVLQAMLFVAGVYFFVIGPALLGWWMRDMRREYLGVQ